ncbi:hypothetical protein [Rhodovulum kholense]|uniref:Uncharacterized protein n=1 Tax=Rhodovulum kholense TaxID=453584 RepID=A0A8E3APF9_9RHOB|nr:hypothetical protein [Rhodovulum kholense]PTW44015.1 hypothetical protein C8N38_11914 [Rhodovulum kholense]
MAGRYFAPRVIALLAHPRRLRLVLAGAVFAGLVLAAALMPATGEILGKAARFVGVALAAEIARMGAPSRIFSAIGARSLEIFLGHQFFIAGAGVMIVALGGPGVATGIVLTPAISLVAVAGSVALREVLGAARMDFIYAPPPPLAHHPSRGAVGAAQG